MDKHINNSEIKFFNKPYKYVIIDNFFKDEVYNNIFKSYKELYKLGTKEQFDKNIISRFPGYDAYCWVFHRNIQYPLSIFHSLEWLLFASNLFKLEITKDIVTEFHHHTINSNGDIPHSDYQECYFVNNPLDHGINPWYFECNYMSPSSNSIKKSRAITAIYYFGEEEWKEGFGGETGVFDNDGKTLINKIAPISNRLFAFEISPISFHGFIKNTHIERNSIIQWLHADPEYLSNKYNTKPLEWSNNDKTGGNRNRN